MSALWGDRPTYSHTGARRRGQHRAPFLLSRPGVLLAAVVAGGITAAGVIGTAHPAPDSYCAPGTFAYSYSATTGQPCIDPAAGR